MPVAKKSSLGRARTSRPTRVKIDTELEKAIRRWKDRVRPLMEAARSSEQLTEDDLAVRINARG